MRTTSVIPADVYDALELSTLAYGGIGADRLVNQKDEPVCLIGHIEFLAGDSWSVTTEIEEDIKRATGVNYLAVPNNDACAAINARKGRPRAALVPFAEYVKERGWIRGD